MPDAATEETAQLVALKRRIAAALAWHDGMGEHRWCVGCDVVSVLCGREPS